MKEIAPKIIKFLKDNGLTQKKVAEILGVSESTVNALVQGRKQFGRKTSAVWESHFGLSASWLMTGEGEMLKQPSIINNTYGNQNAVGEHSKVKVTGQNDTKLLQEQIKILREELQNQRESYQAVINRLLSIVEKQNIS